MPKLTSREKEVFKMVANGMSDKAIESKLVISHSTLRTHIKNLYQKFLFIENPNETSRVKLALKYHYPNIIINSD